VKPTDAELLAQGQALAKVVKEELAHAQWPETLEEAIQPSGAASGWRKELISSL